MKFTYYVMALLLFVSFGATAQETYGPSDVGMMEGPIYVASLAEQEANGTLILADNTPKLGHPKRRHGNNIVPGKGSNTADLPVELQRNAVQQRVQPPILTYIADISSATPSDPTGAAGPNHYVTAWNSSFRIWDKNGNPLTAEASLATLFPGNAIGDPIVFYDAQADRIVITEFDNNPNGFNVAVCQGSNPVTDGWHVYTTGFGTGTFPDYTKFSVFGDKYMVTANINNSNRVFAVERNEMLDGDPAQFVALPLPGIVTSGFYSPQAFHTTDDDLAASTSPCPIVYMQDDAWSGVSDDHIKLWNATIDWNSPGTATMSAAQIITTADFEGVFDGGSFSNRPQGGGVDIDILQATIMNQAQYRRFPAYNSAVFNFVVDVVPGTGNANEKAAIRWYELRQVGGDTQPWVIFQEGTYEAPGGRDAYSGSMAMNSVGDIAMGYTSSSATDRIAIHYTGRFAADPLNVMSVAEENIALSTAANPSNRLADYTQLSVDPIDDTFWYIAEYFEPTRRDVVAHFSLAPPGPDDIGVVAINTPVSGVLGAAEVVEVDIRNFGSNDITDPFLQYTVDGGTPVIEQYSGTITAGTTETFAFAATADLSGAGPFVIESKTNLVGDTNTANDATTKTVLQQSGACIPTATAGCNVDGIKMFVLGSISADDGGNGCNTEPASSPQGYADRRALSTDLTRVSGNDHLLQAQQNWTGGPGVEALSVWIDFNDNDVFEASERLISGEFFQDDNVLEDFSLVIPSTAALGSHTLRAKAIDTSAPGDILDPCTDFDFGEVQDYTVVITDDPLGVNDNVIANSEFVILSKPDNQFEISLTTAFDGVASIYVYDLTGSVVAFNNLSKEGTSYNYKLDMSYASSGVYLVKMGDERSGAFQTGKLIVK